MAESVPDLQTTSQEDLLEVTSSDQTKNSYEEEAKTFPTFGFDVKSQKTNMTLIFGKFRLYVKMSLLEDAFPVFEEMFEEKLVEKAAQEIVIADISCEDFAEFLACIQIRRKRKITKENVYRMLEIASKYEVDDLKERCEDCLLDILGDEKSEAITPIRLLKLATDFDLVTLKSSCIEKADERTVVSVQEGNGSIDLSPRIKCELFDKFIYKAFVLGCLKTAVSSEHAAKLDQFQNAKGLEFKCAIAAGSTFTEEIKLWDCKWTVKIVVPSRSFTSYEGVFSLANNDNPAKQLKSKVAIAVRIRNNIPKKKDRFGIELLTYESRRLSWCFWTALGMTEGDHEDQSLGFRWDEKFSLDAYLLMNKPE